MTSSTTRAFMAKKPFATASAFMAKTNQLFSTITSLRLLLVMFVALTASAEVWGAEKTITLTQSALGLTGSYTTDTEKTIGEVTFVYTDLMKNNDNIQAKASSGIIYNKTAIPGNITKITVTHSGTARSTTVCYGTSAQPTENSTQFSGSKEITVSGSNSFFKITRGSNAAYWTQIVITYETSDSGIDNPSDETVTGTINFNSNAVNINAASVTGDDNLGYSWKITTASTTSFTPQSTYSQVGSSSNPATSITFTTTLPKEVTITNFSAKFGGFSSTAGNVTLKVGDTSVGTGKLNATSDVTVTNTTEATGKVLTVTVTNIAKGVKVYSISYTYESVISEQTYTLTNQANPDGYGTISPSSVEDIPKGTTTSKNANTYTVNGTTVTASPSAKTAQYTYAFSEWQNLPATVNDNATVIAVFTRTTNKYTITWKNYDDTTLKTEEVAYGTTPSYTGTTPTKAATAQYTYTHKGWTPSVVAVTGNATYTATFTETPCIYTITLNTNDGTINAGNVTSYKYGVGATLPTNVTKENHQFGGWFDNSGCTGTAVTAISITATGNKEYWAKWTELPKYIVTWSVDGNTTTEEVYSGKKPTGAPTIDPNNLPCEGADKFVGWTIGEYKGNSAPTTLYPSVDDIPAITGDVTFYAVFADYKQ